MIELSSHSVLTAYDKCTGTSANELMICDLSFESFGPSVPAASGRLLNRAKYTYTYVYIYIYVHTYIHIYIYIYRRERDVCIGLGGTPCLVLLV